MIGKIFKDIRNQLDKETKTIKTLIKEEYSSAKEPFKKRGDKRVSKSKRK